MSDDVKSILGEIRDKLSHYPRYVDALLKAAQEIQENTRLRAALGNSELPCVYCSLPKEEWAQCEFGFPGCSRADDAVGCPHLGSYLKHEAELEKAEQVITPFAEFADPRRKFPPNFTITNGSRMAKKQLTMDDCYSAADWLAQRKKGKA